MRFATRCRLTPSMVLAFAALFVALVGTSSGQPILRTIAGSSRSVTKKQVEALIRHDAGVVSTNDFSPANPDMVISFTKLRANTELLISWSGTGYRTSAGLGGLVLSVDGQKQDLTNQFVNNPNGHLTFPAGHKTVTGLAAGTHTIQVAEDAGTTRDVNDVSFISIVEVTPTS